MIFASGTFRGLFLSFHHVNGYSITKAFCIAFVMTFFSVFDVPVFWPILLFYWLMLFILTMKRQILHMIKYKYVPFSFGKQVYLDPYFLCERQTRYSLSYFFLCCG
ncbi:hypothetical protein Gogos_015145 [Gossypium gossypioides]|uniref:Protein RER1 n=1 Tax=Gossypium gossypioides TaxID=34282 RepID=A0A7J9C0P0_GOSGO|nr:hypothetical protein [Gossypium gossypioides]